MNNTDRTQQLALTLLESIGCPWPCADLWRPEGVQLMLRRWNTRVSGSAAELQKILLPLDPEIRVTSSGLECGPAWAVELPWDAASDRRMLLGLAPRRRVLRLHIMFGRKFDARRLARFREAVEEVVRRWMPLEVDEVRYSMAPAGGALGIARTAADAPCTVADTAPRPHRSAVRRRGGEVPATTVLSVEGEPRTHAGGMVVVADANYRRFVANVEPFRPQWRCHVRTPGTAECEATMPNSVLHLLIPPTTVAHEANDLECRINHQVVPLQPGARPELWRFRFPSPVSPSARVLVACRRRKTGEPVEFHTNPVVCETVLIWEDTLRHSGRSHRWVPACGTEAAEPASFCTPVAGIRDIGRVEQPCPVRPCFEDGSSVWVRGSQIVRGIRRAFLEVQDVRCWTEFAWVPGSRPCFVRRAAVAVTVSQGPGTPAPLLRGAIEDLLRLRLPESLEPHVTCEESRS